jgi:hypothetical protein
MIFESCASLDVVGKDAVRAFGDVLAVIPAQGEKGSWSITAPDDSSNFTWHNQGIAVSFDLQPFIAAGLDLSKIDLTKISNASGGRISLAPPGFNMLNEDVKDTAIEQFEKDAQTYAIGYHTALDHFNIDLGNGNMFEWAKDMATNDKDIVFVLNPEPFIEAGVDPDAVEGWSYSAVSVDVNGKATEVFKLLKAFDLK